jgi:hypothetical protein
MAEINSLNKFVKYIVFRHLAFLLLFVFVGSVVNGQNPKSQPGARKKILLQNADVDSILRDPVSGTDIHYLKGNVRLLDNETKMSCDSAHFSPAKNQVTAFNKVHIQQGDTLNLYGDYLFYDGKLSTAFVKGNVELVDKETHLYTDSIHYDVKNRVAKYTERGRIKNAENTLTSIIGVYYASQKLFHFKDSVKIVNPKYVMTADTMDYNSLSEIAYFTGPTVLKGDSIYLYCEKGWYDTKKEITSVWKNAVIDNRHQIIHGDSLYFNNNTGFGESFRNVIIQDTVNDLAITGNYAWIYKEPERFLVTDKAVFIQISNNKDSLFLHADTINSVSIPIIIKKPTEPAKTTLQGKVTNKENQTGSAANKQVKTNTVTSTMEAIKAVTGKTDTIKSIAGKFQDSNVKTDSVKALIDKYPVATIKTDSIKSLVDKSLAATVKTDSIKSLVDKSLAAKVETSVKDSIKSIADKSQVIKLAAGKIDSVKTSINKTDTIKPENKVVAAVKKPATSYRLMKAFHHVRIYSKDLQAKCDSMSYSFQDSVIRLYKAPVIWSAENQLTADSMALFTKNRQSDRLELYNQAFITSLVDTIRYNQIKGRSLTGYFKNNELFKIDIKGNGESVYYLLEGEAVAGRNQSKCANIQVLLDKGHVSEIYEYENPDGTIDPPLPPKPVKLEGFKWLDSIRPKKRTDIFIITK